MACVCWTKRRCAPLSIHPIKNRTYQRTLSQHPALAHTQPTCVGNDIGFFPSATALACVTSTMLTVVSALGARCRNVRRVQPDQQGPRHISSRNTRVRVPCPCTRIGTHPRSLAACFQCAHLGRWATKLPQPYWDTHGHTGDNIDQSAIWRSARSAAGVLPNAWR